MKPYDTLTPSSVVTLPDDLLWSDEFTWTPVASRQVTPSYSRIVCFWATALTHLDEVK